MIRDRVLASGSSAMITARRSPLSRPGERSRLARADRESILPTRVTTCGHRVVGDPFLHSASFLALLLLDGSQAGGPMRIPIAVLVISAGIVVVDGVVARAESRDVPAVRVRVYDYAGVVEDTLTEAQSVAATFYTAIDVAIDWAPTMGPRARKRSDVENGRLQDFTIIVLSRSMVARRVWPAGAIGSAVVAREGGGRIAYEIGRASCRERVFGLV